MTREEGRRAVIRKLFHEHNAPGPLDNGGFDGDDSAIAFVLAVIKRWDELGLRPTPSEVV
jgi:hypothetical protein